MKTRLQLLIVSISAAGLLLTGLALAQETSPGSPTPATTASSSQESTAAPAVSAKIKAVVYHEYGSPDVLRIEEVDKPVPNDNQLLVKVRAVSINPLDWHFVEGTPYVMRGMGVGLLKPTLERFGVDYAGTVEAVGKNVTQFKPGDEVFGGKNGAFAEYITVMADRAVALKPANISFEQAASVPIAGITALQALRDSGKVQPGQKILINGASGGVGTFAVQIAKSLGADVTGVCSTKNVDLVRSLGADQVIDYTKEDFTKSGQRYDVVLDNVGTQPLLGFMRVLNPNGRYVLIGGGGPNDAGFVGPLARPVKTMVLSRFVNKKMGMMFAELNHKDLAEFADLMQSGKVKPVIDRTYPLNQISDALRYLEAGHARGKVVLTVEENAAPVSATPAAAPANTRGPIVVAGEFFAVVVGVTILPIILALVFNRRFQQRNPGKRPFRWGYYFAIMSFVVVVGLALLLDLGATTVIALVIIYGLLALCFVKHHRSAWIILTLLSFNPIAWIINFFYLRKRCGEA
jgi:NADPH:quinone reductase-like Zn-dependent oxidoreductase